jgi:hypothetical protein
MKLKLVAAVYASHYGLPTTTHNRPHHQATSQGGQQPHITSHIIQQPSTAIHFIEQLQIQGLAKKRCSSTFCAGLFVQLCLDPKKDARSTFCLRRHIYHHRKDYAT